MDSARVKGRWEQSVGLDYLVESVVPAECVFNVLGDPNPGRCSRTTQFPCPTAM